ncbi:MAG: hypothetical protein VX738_12450 [Planctomycetota bacterium]|nr:hypothetical protein [Planctomycetota bacterium]
MKNKRIHRSSGVTIIEVLFSIGIVITGLLGVAGLIMVAGTQMTQGLEADAMSNAGLNAIAEFDTRNMRRPDNMLWYNSNTNTFTSVLSNTLFGPGDDGMWGTAGHDDDFNGIQDDISEAGYSGSDDIPSPSLCIDPYFIAKQVVDKNTRIYESNTFPGIQIPAGNPNQIMTMRRVTLKNPAFATQILSLLQSREIFIAKDDLAFNTPASGTELPQQQWITEGLGGPAVKRLNQAETSWLATLTPNRNRMNVAAARLEKTDHYLLSIVIFDRRFVDFIDPNSGPLKDRLLNIAFLNRGFGGGEVRLSHSDPAALDLRHGDWVMLSANSQIGPFHRWYRITYIEEETETTTDTLGNVTGHYRNATLQGPDWSRPEWHPVVSGGTPQYPTHVTYIPRVIGVFEKTIRLESTSLY